MRFTLIAVAGFAFLLITGCSSILNVESRSPSAPSTGTISAYDLLTPLAKPIDSESIVGTWSGSIEWQPRKVRTSRGEAIPLAMQGAGNNVWSLRLSITQQRMENGELSLQGRATIYPSDSPTANSIVPNWGGGSFFFSGFVLVKIVKKIIIIRLFLDDGTVILIKKCRIVLIFRSISTGKLWGKSRIYGCSDIFTDWTSFGSVRLERMTTPILSERH